MHLSEKVLDEFRGATVVEMTQAVQHLRNILLPMEVSKEAKKAYRVFTYQRGVGTEEDAFYLALRPYLSKFLEKS